MPLTGRYEPSTSLRAREQAETYEATAGQEANTLGGRPIIVMTSVGARTGHLRKTPLMRVEHDGQYAVLASANGREANPVWYYNLVKNPHVELQDGANKRDYLAHEAAGEERALWWERAVSAWPAFNDYTKGLMRVIPLFVLTPMDDGA